MKKLGFGSNPRGNSNHVGKLKGNSRNNISVQEVQEFPKREENKNPSSDNLANIAAKPLEESKLISDKLKPFDEVDHR